MSLWHKYPTCVYLGSLGDRTRSGFPGQHFCSIKEIAMAKVAKLSKSSPTFVLPADVQKAVKDFETTGEYTLPRRLHS